MLHAIYKDILKKRQYWKEWEEQRDEKFVFPDSVLYLPDVRIGDGEFDRVDVYRPKESGGALPVAVNIHGGGLVMGTKHQNLGLCMFLAERGFLVLAVEYPLVPEVTVYEQLRVMARVLDLLGTVIAEHGGDPGRISLTGDSAGAFLALYTAAIQKSRAISQAAGVEPCTLPIQRLGLSSGLFYSTRVESNGIFLLRNSFFGKGWRKQDFAQYLNPEHEELLEALPPCFLSTSEGDFLKSHTLRFAKALARHGKEHVLWKVPDKVEHAFNALYPEWEASRATNEAMISFLRE